MSFSLSRHFAETITSKFNQHVSMVTVGHTGSGKSNANLRLGYNVACEVAKIKGGTWHDYFNIDHIAVITREEIMRVMQVNRKYSVILLDDIGVGMSARNWNKEENKLLNEIIQTFRTDNTCLLLTLPDTFMLDKIPRHLSHWFCEMDTSIFEKNVSIAKVFELFNQPRSGKMFYKYPRTAGHAKSIRTVFRIAPDEIRIPYEEKRTQIAKELKDDRMEAYQQLMDKYEAEKNGEVVLSKKELKKQDSINKSIQVLELIKEKQSHGIKITQAKACGEIGISPSTFRDYKHDLDTEGVLC